MRRAGLLLAAARLESHSTTAASRPYGPPAALPSGALFSRQLSSSAPDADDPYGPPPLIPQRRVVVTGLGAVSPLGLTAQSSWDALLGGRTAVRALQEEDLPQSHWDVADKLPSKVAACIDRKRFHALLEEEGYDVRRTAPFISYALASAAEALEDAEWIPLTLESRQATGVAIGSGMSSTTDIAEAAALITDGKLRRVSPFFVPRILPNMAAGAVSIRYGLLGPNHCASTACASGSHSIGDAFQLVRSGAAEVMVAGASEAAIDAVSIGGFSRLKALSTSFNDEPPRASRPFDRDRDGFVIGEGAGVLVLEDLQHALDRGVPIYAEVRGYGMSGDAHHITSPNPLGEGAVLAMKRALAQAGIDPDDVAYINAHATSTPVGDDIEQRAIAEVFGERATTAGSGLLVSSTKGATGHLLGAAGAVEAVFSVLAMQHRMAPPTVNLEAAEPNILGNLVRNTAQPFNGSAKAVLSNSFGFGGTNSSLVFAPPPLPPDV